MTRPPRNIAASVRQRLLDRARREGSDYNLILVRYAHERLLYRLAKSRHHDRFILKGASLFTVWHGSPHRPTKDLDLLGFGDPAPMSLAGAFQEICALDVEDDGMRYHDDVRAEPIGALDDYGGVRLRINADLAGARLALQIDVGFGDVITPAPQIADFPALLQLPAPRLRVYPRETVVAEKLETIVRRAIANTRLKDYFDLHYLLSHFQFDGETLTAAIAHTFQRRSAELPQQLPLGLTPHFSHDHTKQVQWNALRRRIRSLAPDSLPEVIDQITVFAAPALRAAAAGAPFPASWTPPGPWTEPQSPSNR